MLWGIDLGGTKIEGVVLESSPNARVISRVRIATEAHRGYDHILDRIDHLIRELQQESGTTPERIGMGTPGSIDPHTGLLKNSNTTSLNHKPFRTDLISRIKIPVTIANDANCFALAETKVGAVRDIGPETEVVFGVIMGTGVGGGIVIKQSVLNGHQGIAGEWGHNYLDHSGGSCYCGKTGCVEKILSGPALQEFHKMKGGTESSMQEIVHAARKGDQIAQQTMKRLYHFFGLGIASVINILDPDIIVLGGGLSNIDELYNNGVEEVKKHVFNTHFNTKIVPPKLGDSAGVIGAAFLSASSTP